MTEAVGTKILRLRLACSLRGNPCIIECTFASDGSAAFTHAARAMVGGLADLAARFPVDDFAPEALRTSGVKAPRSGTQWDATCMYRYYCDAARHHAYVPARLDISVRGIDPAAASLSPVIGKGTCRRRAYGRRRPAQERARGPWGRETGPSRCAVCS